MKFISNNLKKPKLVFIDGLTRTGKSLLSGIIPSFKNFEHLDFANILLSSYHCKLSLTILKATYINIF